MLLRIVCSVLFLYVVFPLYAQEKEVIRKLDLLLQDQRDIIRKLERLYIWEIKKEISALKRNLRRLREIKRLVNTLQKSGSGRSIRDLRNLQDELSNIYNRLSEIPLATRTTTWRKLEKAWLRLQSTSPEFLNDSELGFYQDQLKNLARDFRRLDLDTMKQFRAMLQDGQDIYFRLQKYSWVNPVRWKLIGGSWQKSWQNRKEGEEDLAHFERLYSQLKRLEIKTRKKHQQALQQLQKLQAKAQKQYQLLDQTSFATRQKKWAEYERQWYDLSELQVDTLTPLQLKRHQLNLNQFYNSLRDYQFTLKQDLSKLFQETETFFHKVHDSPWAKSSKIYDTTIAQWEQNWQNKIYLSLEDANAIESLRLAFKRIERESTSSYQKNQERLNGLRANIEKLVRMLSSSSLLKRHAPWFALQKTWRELEYISIDLNTSQKDLHKYRQRLNELYTKLQELYVSMQKETSDLLQKAKDIYSKLAQDGWAQDSPQWQQLKKDWTKNWSWKQKVTFSETAKLEKIISRLQLILAAGNQRRNYELEQARNMRKNVKNYYQKLRVLGPEDPNWKGIEQAWHNFKNTNLDTLAPDKVQQYFKEGKQLQERLRQSQRTLNFYCVQLLYKTKKLHEKLLANPWASLIPEWNKLSQRWIMERPLSQKITIDKGVAVADFYKKFRDIQAQIKRRSEARLDTLQLQRRQLQAQYAIAQKTEIITRNNRWPTFENAFKKFLQQDYAQLKPRQQITYQEELQTLSKKLQTFLADGEQKLYELWSKIRRDYQAFKQNSWTNYLLNKSNFAQLWEPWANRQKLELEHGATLLKLEKRLQYCRPFWWRPLLPQKKLPQKAFVYDVFEVPVEGIPSVPQWSTDGSLLSFQSSIRGNWAIHILDIISGQRKTIELYDARQRWVAFPAWAPAPYDNVLAFSGKKQGFYDLYRVDYSRTQFPETQPLTNSPEYEKFPQWLKIEKHLYLLFIRGKDLCYRRNDDSEHLLIGRAPRFSEITDFAAYVDADNQIRIAVCAQVNGSKTTGVYYGVVKSELAQLAPAELRKVSEIEGKHFSPQWTQDGRWIVCYLQNAPRKTKLVRIHPEIAREHILHQQGNILMSPSVELHFKPPELFGVPDRVLYCLEMPGQQSSQVTITSIEDMRSWHWDNPQNLRLFCETTNIAISPNGNFLAWTYLQAGVGRKLAIALINLTDMER